MHQVFADLVPCSPADSNFFRYVAFIFKKSGTLKIRFHVKSERGSENLADKTTSGCPPLAKSMLLYRANKHNLPVKEHKNED